MKKQVLLTCALSAVLIGVCVGKTAEACPITEYVPGTWAWVVETTGSNSCSSSVTNTGPKDNEQADPKSFDMTYVISLVVTPPSVPHICGPPTGLPSSIKYTYSGTVTGFTRCDTSSGTNYAQAPVSLTGLTFFGYPWRVGGSVAYQTLDISQTATSLIKTGGDGTTVPLHGTTNVETKYGDQAGRVVSGQVTLTTGLQLIGDVSGQAMFPVPEPASMALLALGACLPLLRRRR